LPEGYKLNQNYPNPFNPKTVIEYSIPSAELVKLRIYNILGHEIKMLVNENQSPGTYKVTFDGSSLPSGVYYYRLETKNNLTSKSMLLIK